MGQYYLVCNLDKQEYLHPHRFGDGLKLLEFGCSSTGTMTGLAVLLASGNGRGGGDLRSEREIIGSWAGDRVVVTGDYDDPGLWVPSRTVEGNETNLFDEATDEWEDISFDVLEALADDRYIGESIVAALKRKRTYRTLAPEEKALLRRLQGVDEEEEENMSTDPIPSASAS